MRYNNVANLVINVELPNEYIITAMADYQKEDNTYITTFYVNHKTVTMLDLVEDFEKIGFISDIKTIKMDITRFIDQKYKAGAFDKYIERYDRMLQCFDLGNEMLENMESLDNEV